MFLLQFFFFKQKTAYEVRISDWSSDVCSSDLFSGGRTGERAAGRGAGAARGFDMTLMAAPDWLRAEVVTLAWCWRLARRDGVVIGFTSQDRDLVIGGLAYRAAPGMKPSRSEEHTSDLQSLMRTS